MSKSRFTIFEHQSLIEGTLYGKTLFTSDNHQQLVRFFKEKNFPYYTLIRNGVKFNEYVGVIQIGNTIVEVLPKVEENDEHYWRKMLIEMIRSVGIFKIKAPTSSNLNIKNNSILELYFEMFIDECQGLLRNNLIKKYRKVERNVFALKGCIVFNKHLQQNLTHKERFYTKHTVYDNLHPLNCVLYKTIRLLRTFVKSEKLKSRIGELMLNFPEMPDIGVNEPFFKNIQYNRKTDPYKAAIEISRLILLNYHPDVNKGNNNVLALMFNMNELWEKFVIKSLINHCGNGLNIERKPSRNFWSFDGVKKMYPDIVITDGEKCKLILDTKWKNIGEDWASDNDLRQMYTYSKFYDGAGCTLIYPGIETKTRKGNFMDEVNNQVISSVTCDLITLKVNSSIVDWQREITQELMKRIS